MRRLMPLVAVWAGLSVLMAGWFLLSEWPAHPHTPLGWTFLLAGALPVALLGEYLSDRLILRTRLATRLDALGSGFGASALRVAYVLFCVIAILAVILAAVAWLARQSP
jgi:hypothetical protein